MRPYVGIYQRCCACHPRAFDSGAEQLTKRTSCNRWFQQIGNSVDWNYLNHGGRLIKKKEQVCFQETSSLLSITCGTPHPFPTTPFFSPQEQHPLNTLESCPVQGVKSIHWSSQTILKVIASSTHLPTDVFFCHAISCQCCISQPSSQFRNPANHLIPSRQKCR